MPRMGHTETETHTLANNFAFSGARIANLGATEYTLVDIELDMSGSVTPFKADIIQALETAIDACRRSPRSDNLLVRVAAFSSSYSNGMSEVHGYIPLADIDVAEYQKLRAYGGTPLFDATFMSIGGMNAYAKMLVDQDFLVNGISFIITDGDDTGSATTPSMIKAEVEKATISEVLESHISVLIGINASACTGYLQRFKTKANISQYIDAGAATKGNLAKLAAFVSQSISSTSQAIGTGGPSQAIAATI